MGRHLGQHARHHRSIQQRVAESGRCVGQVLHHAPDPVGVRRDVDGVGGEPTARQRTDRVEPIPVGRGEQLGRHDPGRPAAELTVLIHLRQRDKAQLGVTGGDKLMRLGDVLPFDQLVLHCRAQAELAQHFSGCQAVGRGFRVGNRQMFVLIGLERRVAAIQIIRLGRPQHQPSNCIGKA